MSAFMLIASALIAAQVVALSLLVGDAIRRERSGETLRAWHRPVFPAAYTGVERRRAPRTAGAFGPRAA